MIDANAHHDIWQAVCDRVAADAARLDELRADVRPLRDATRRIQPRSATALSLVATDGGNNQLRFDPFLVQLIRVGDSNENELCLEAISPTTPIADLDRRHIDRDGRPLTALGRMMATLGVSSLRELSLMVRADETGLPRSVSIVQTYCELIEWAILYDLFRKDYGSDTLIVFDGDLRSKIFSRDLFIRLGKLIAAEIDRHLRQRRQLFLVGVMKSSNVLTRYRLALAVEGVLKGAFPAFIPVPRELEEKVYRWKEFALGEDRGQAPGEEPKQVLGKMFFVKFGNRPGDPIWRIDVFIPQVSEAGRIFGHLLADAIEGFPMPLYPRCLQKAHERAALHGFDMEIFQDLIVQQVRASLGSDYAALDALLVGDPDPAQAGYS